MARGGSDRVRPGFDAGLISVRFGGRSGSRGRGQDWVRFFRGGGEAVDVSGWYARGYGGMGGQKLGSFVQIAQYGFA